MDSSRNLIGILLFHNYLSNVYEGPNVLSDPGDIVENNSTLTVIIFS